MELNYSILHATEELTINGKSADQATLKELGYLILSQYAHRQYMTYGSHPSRKTAILLINNAVFAHNVKGIRKSLQGWRGALARATKKALAPKLEGAKKVREF